jgi:hypothetical protein
MGNMIAENTTEGNSHKNFDRGNSHPVDYSGLTMPIRECETVITASLSKTQKFNYTNQCVQQ